MKHEPERTRVRHVVKVKLPTHWCVFDLHCFEIGDQECLALSLGDFAEGKECLLRLHSECLTGDTLFSQRCDCGDQLQAALKKIADHGSGLLLYLRQEGRGIGLANKLMAYALQDRGLDTVDANIALGLPVDARDYRDCKQILDFFAISRIRLMTNNPRKVMALSDIGFDVIERIPLVVGHSKYNHSYLSTKATRLGHLLS